MSVVRHEIKYAFLLSAEESDLSDQAARGLADELREIDGVDDVRRKKSSPLSMDLGSLVEILATSGAGVAIARGVADWMRRHREIRLVITRQEGSRSIKAEVEKVDAQTALSIVEKVLKTSASSS